jgi:hypothetical protein
MASVVLVETNGTLKTLKTKELSLDTLYKKCGFRVNDDFLCRHTWHVKLPSEPEKISVSVWAKKTGKANFENKYDFPPPIDKDLFFGTCAIVRTQADGTFLDLTKETWLKVYEKLFGGFEDIGDEDEYSEDELANVDPSLLTANGYLKDGFVVSDKEGISSAGTSAETTSVDTSEEEVVVKPVKKRVSAKNKAASAVATVVQDVLEVKPIVNVKTKVKVKVKVKAKPRVKEIEPEPVNAEGSDGTTSELEEEVYTFSDDD